MFNQPLFGVQNQQSDFGFKPGVNNGNISQGLFGNTSAGNTNTFGGTSFGTNSPTSTGFSFGGGVQGSSAGTLGNIPGQQQTTGLFGQSSSTIGTNVGFNADQKDAQMSQNMFGVYNPVGLEQNTGGIIPQFGGMFPQQNQNMTISTFNAGTENPAYNPVFASDIPNSGAKHKIEHICAQENYSEWSIEELRWKDYRSGRRPQQKPQSALGSSTGFGLDQTQKSSLSGPTPFQTPGTSMLSSSQFQSAPFNQTSTASSTANHDVFRSFESQQAPALPQGASQSFFFDSHNRQGGLFGASNTSLDSTSKPAGTMFPSFGAGAPQSTPSSFGLFGSQNTSQAPGLSTFGHTPTQASPFGSFKQNLPPPSQNSVFSNTTQQQTGSLFQTPQTGSSFLTQTQAGLAPSTSSAEGLLFGGGQGTSLFGSAQSALGADRNQQRDQTAPKFGTCFFKPPAPSQTLQIGSQPSTFPGFQSTKTSQFEGSTSLFDTSVNSLFGATPEAGSTVNFFQPQMQQPTSFFGAQAQPQIPRLFPSMDGNPYGVFNDNAFPEVSKVNKGKVQTDQGKAIRPDKLVATKIAERYFSNIKLPCTNYGSEKPSLELLARSPMLHDYKLLDLNVNFTFLYPNKRLLVEGVNTEVVSDFGKKEDELSEKNKGEDVSNIKRLLFKDIDMRKQHVNVNINVSDDKDGSHITGISENKRRKDEYEKARFEGEYPGGSFSGPKYNGELDAEIDDLPFVSDIILSNGENERCYRPHFIPSLKELVKLSDRELRDFQNFKVWSPKVGSVTFIGGVNFYDLVDKVTVKSLWEKLSETVILMRRSISVYPFSAKKHPIGRGLNVEAIIELRNCFPGGLAASNEGDDSDTVVAPMMERRDYVRLLRKARNTEFLSYDENNGLWKFKVEHFTTYGLKKDGENGVTVVGLISNDDSAESRGSKKPRIGDESMNKVPKKGPEVVRFSEPSDKKEGGGETMEAPPPSQKSINNEAVIEGDKGLPAVESVDMEMDGWCGACFSPGKRNGWMPKGSSVKNVTSHSSEKPPLSGSPKVSPLGEVTFHPYNTKISGICHLLPFKEQVPALLVQTEDDSRDDALGCVLEEPVELPLPCENSYAGSIEGKTIDTMAANRRAFRPGWGPRGTLVTVGRGGMGFSSRVFIIKVNLFQVMENSPRNVIELTTGLYEKLLSIALAETSFSPIKREQLEYETCATSPKNTAPRTGDSSASLSSQVNSMESTVSISGTPASATDVGYEEARGQKLLIQAVLNDIGFKAFLRGLTNLPMESNTTKVTSLSIAEVYSMFRLASALWDPLPEGKIKRDTNEKHYSYLVEGVRRQNLSTWLREHLEPSLKESLKCSDKPHDSVFSHLVTGQALGAINIALKEKYYRLAILITQSCGGSYLKLSREPPSNISKKPSVEIIESGGYCARGIDENFSRCTAHQVEIWSGKGRGSRVKMFNPCIPPAVMRIWALCSGQVRLWDESIFSHTYGWKNAFGLFLWYGGQSSWTISQALKSYENAFKNYLEVKCPISSFASMDDFEKGIHTDPCYLFLKVYGRTESNLRRVFVSGNYSKTPLDCIFPWIICVTLLSRIGEGGKNSQELEFTQSSICVLNDIFQRLTISLVFTLDGIQLTKWAIYVALFISRHELRLATVKRLLVNSYPREDVSGSSFLFQGFRGNNRVVSIFGSPQRTPHKDSELYQFLTRDLRLPPAWIHEVRALRAFYDGSCMQLLTTQMDSGAFALAYHTLVLALFTGPVVSGDMHLIDRLISTLESKIENPRMKKGLSFLQRCVSTIETGRRLRELWVREEGPMETNENSRGAILACIENLKYLICIFSTEVTLEGVLGITPLHLSDPVYRSLSQRFTAPNSNLPRDDANTVKGGVPLEFGICWNIIFEECFDLLVNLQYNFPEYASEDVDKRVRVELASCHLPLTPVQRILKLRDIAL